MNASFATRAARLSVGLALAAATPALAQGPVELSNAPIPENAAWKNEVIGTGELSTRPARIQSVTGSVTNAQGLVDPAAGPATLTYTPGGTVPMVVLDYGREVGGLPYFTASQVAPAGDAASVTLRAAYTEALEFLWTPGNTTLSLAAAAGDTNLKVGSVSNFVVGDTLRVGGETARIGAVGTQSRATSLFAAAAAGDTNVKVAATTGLAAGDALRVGDETVTITTVGTQGRATTLAAAAAAGATNVKVASVTGLVADSTITIGDQTARIVSVGTQGANGTGLTLAEPLAAAAPNGTPVRYAGTGITFSPALAGAHAQNTTVLAPGTGITLAAPLAGAQAAGTAVRSTPGAVTGDRVGFNGVGMSGSRAESFTVSAPGTFGNAANQMQGGQRFQAIMLTTPGTLTLSAVGINFRHPNSGPDDYAGHFLSSDDKLNKIWYQGAYTNDTNSVPIGAVPGQTIPVILDGAKRDRRPWSGDLDLQGRTAFTSLGFGAKGSDYIKGTLHAFGGTQGADGRIYGHIQNWTVWPPSGGFYSTSYSMYHVLSVAVYYHYSADIEFARAQYEIIKRQLAYNRTLVDPNLGLLITGAGGEGRDWNFYDGGKPGAVTAYNAIYYKALTDAAYLASELAARYPQDAAAAGWQADAATWTSQAADIKQRVNATLFDPARGVYKLADRDNQEHSGNAVPQDGNSQAIQFDIAPESARDGILRFLRNTLWGTFGPQPYSPEANYSTVISPFVTGKEVDARFHAGDTEGALDLIHLMWDQMVDEDGPYYTGTVWEKLNQDGTDVDANASLAHGWASGPVSSLSHYVAGARPVTAGYKTWAIAPQVGGDLEWAQGQLPTPSGPLVSRWRLGSGSSSFTLTMSAPAGTSGTVSIPLLGRSRTIAMDGAVVWQDGRPLAGLAAVERDGAVHFSGVTGARTFAWGTVTADEDGTVGGTVPPTLSLTLGAPASFGTFAPGVERTYEASTTANVTSTAGDATLSVADPSSTATGRLVNGSFSLAEPLAVRADGNAFAPLSGSPLALLSYDGPVSNDAVAIGFRQRIGSGEALRTGAYGKTLTFTLSTTSP